MLLVGGLTSMLPLCLQNEDTINAEVKEKETIRNTEEDLVRMVTIKEEEIPTEITTGR